MVAQLHEVLIIGVSFSIILCYLSCGFYTFLVYTADTDSCFKKLLAIFCPFCFQSKPSILHGGEFGSGSGHSSFEISTPERKFKIEF